MLDKNSNKNINYIEPNKLNEISLFKHIMCPVLRMGIRSEKLVMDGDGRVAVSALYDYMSFIGVDRDSLVIKRVIEGAKASPNDQEINIADFKGSLFDHGSVSGIFRYEVLDSTNEETIYSKPALEAFIAMSRDKENMDLDDLSEATNRFHQCPFHKIKTSLFGVVATTFEYALMLHFFGRTNNAGKKYLTLDDIKRIWGESKFPLYWFSPQKAEFGTLDFIVKTVVFGWLRLDLKIMSRFRSNNPMASKVRASGEGDI